MAGALVSLGPVLLLKETAGEPLLEEQRPAGGGGSGGGGADPAVR